MEIVAREPLRHGGSLNARGVAKYSDFGPIEGYSSETVRDRRYKPKLVLITNRKSYMTFDWYQDW